MIDRFLYGLIEKEWKYKNKRIFFIDLILFLFATLFACMIRYSLFTYRPETKIISTGLMSSLFQMLNITGNISIIKIIHVIFDYVSALSVAVIVYKGTQNLQKAILSYTVILFVPTTLMNSFMICSGDSIYISFLLLSIYLILQKHSFSSMILYGIATVINPIAFIIFPFYLILLIQKRLKITQFLIPFSIWLLYFLYLLKAGQTYGISTLSDLFPNLYQIIGTSSYVKEYSRSGLLYTLFVMLVIVFGIGHKNIQYSQELQIRICLFVVMLISFIMPGMQAKDGQLLAILSIIYAFYDLKRFPVPLIISASTFAAGTAYLTQSTMVPLYVYSILNLILLIYLGTDIYKSILQSTIKTECEITEQTTQKTTDKNNRMASGSNSRVNLQLRDLLLLAVMTCIGIGIRIVFRHVESMDYTVCLRPWVEEFKRIGSLKAIAGDFYNYTPPYMYIIYLISLVPIQPLYLIKAVSILFDLVISVLSAFIINFITGKKERALLAYGIVFCLPTVAVNSGLWGQCDVIYVTFIIASLYFILKERPKLCMICFGIAFALKLQTLFVFPLYFFLWTKKKLKLWHFLYIPAMYILCCIPSALGGKSWKELLLVYVAQGNTEPWMLSWNWPNIYLLFGPNNFFEHYAKAGVFGTIAVLMIVLYYMVLRFKKIDYDLIIRGMLFFSLIVPFFLPYMHERYGFIADILAIIYALYKPRKFYIALVEILLSFTAYTGYLNGASTVPQTFYCFVMTLLVIAVTLQLFIPDWEIKYLPVPIPGHKPVQDK